MGFIHETSKNMSKM